MNQLSGLNAKKINKAGGEDRGKCVLDRWVREVLTGRFALDQKPEKNEGEYHACLEKKTFQAEAAVRAKALKCLNLCCWGNSKEPVESDQNEVRGQEGGRNIR